MSHEFPTIPNPEAGRKLTAAQLQLMGNAAMNRDFVAMMPALQDRQAPVQRPITNVDPALIDRFRQKARQDNERKAAASQRSPEPGFKRLPDGRLSHGNFIYESKLSHLPNKQQ